MTDGGAAPNPKVRLACKCGGEMVHKTNRTTGGTFYGCSNWSGTPDGCNETLSEKELPAWVHVSRQGAAPLPGFEGL